MRRLTTSFVALVIVIWFMYLWIYARPSAPTGQPPERSSIESAIAPATVRADPISGSRPGPSLFRSGPHR